MFSHYVNFTSWYGSNDYKKLTTPLHHNKLISFLRGMKLNSTGGNVKNIQLIKTMHNDTYWNITVVKPENIVISFLEFDLIAVSTNFVGTYTQFMYWLGSINSTSSGYTLTNTSILTQPMMLMGLSFF